MNKRPERTSLRGMVPQTPAEVVKLAVAAAAQMQGQPEPVADDKEAMTITTIHLPAELLEALQQAAVQRAAQRRRENAKGRGGRPSVSEIIRDVLDRHRGEWAG